MSHIHFTILCVLVLLLNTVMRLVSGQMGQVARMAPGQHARRFHSALSPTQQQPTSELLALWIDSNEVEKISGYHVIRARDMGLLPTELSPTDIRLENFLPEVKDNFVAHMLL
ncbi:hypothetical protein HELRODRAFT_173129 [Helobdella robusta]|uniref:Uncharacterized protein n=1 Tax=Helobdella robusta TaxID=6412 RepID=T1F6F0_HELRO|nr:hypothetical protein HELRODRAFT_173129 [Helobdella robusta]ESO04055.1 hypothetical protein HELRODRAFT_173129 [Helobdella robusta]